MPELATLNGQDAIWLVTYKDRTIPAIGKTAKEACDRASGKLGPDASFSNCTCDLERTLKLRETMQDAMLEFMTDLLNERRHNRVFVDELQKRNCELHEQLRSVREQLKAQKARTEALLQGMEDEQLARDQAGADASDGEEPTDPAVTGVLPTDVSASGSEAAPSLNGASGG